MGNLTMEGTSPEVRLVTIGNPGEHTRIVAKAVVSSDGPKRMGKCLYNYSMEALHGLQAAMDAGVAAGGSRVPISRREYTNNSLFCNDGGKVVIEHRGGPVVRVYALGQGEKTPYPRE